MTFVVSPEPRDNAFALTQGEVGVWDVLTPLPTVDPEDPVLAPTLEAPPGVDMLAAVCESLCERPPTVGDVSVIPVVGGISSFSLGVSDTAVGWARMVAGVQGQAKKHAQTTHRGTCG